MKELLPLLEDEPFRLGVQNGLLESTDYAAVQDCLRCRYGHEGTELAGMAGKVAGSSATAGRVLAW